jgi:hypothetical protein
MSGNTLLVHKGVTYKQLFGKINVDKNMNRNIIDNKNKNQLNISLKATPTFSNVVIDKTDFDKDNYAATVGYVKENLNKLDAKDSVVVATTANIANLSDTQTIDDIPLAVNNRVLVKDQSDQKQNGIYIVASGAWARSADFANSSKQQGSYVYVEKGNTNKNKGFMLTGGQKTIGTNDLEFAQFNGTPAFETGDGLTRDGNTLYLNNSLDNVTEMTGLIAVGSNGENTTFSGPIVASQGLNGNVVGDLSGNVTGDVTGDVSGNLTGNVTGNADTASAAQVGSNLANKISRLSENGTTFTGDVTGNADTASAAKANSNLANKISRLSDDGNTFSGNVTGNADTASAALSGSALFNKLSGLNENGNTFSGNVTGNADTASAAQVGSDLAQKIRGLTISGNLEGDLSGNVTKPTQTHITTMPRLSSIGTDVDNLNIFSNEVTIYNGPLSAKGGLIGDVSGNLTGNVVGDLSGNLIRASVIKLNNSGNETDPGNQGQLWVDASGYVRMSIVT